MTDGPERMERLRDAVSGVALFSFALALWFYLIPVFAGGHGKHTILAQIASLLIGGLSVLLLALVAAGLPVESRAASDDDPFLKTGQGREPARIFILLGLWGLYVAALPYAGFYLGGAVALPLTYALLGVRMMPTACLWTAGTLTAIFLVFEYGFKLALPAGALVRRFQAGF